MNRSWELLRALVAKEFKVRYKNTALGFLWSLAHPVFFAVVFWVAFQHILRVPVENYFVFLLAGMFPWQWFANVVNTSPTVFLQNAGLIKKVYFPRFLLPLATLGNHMIHFLLALLVAIPVAVAAGARPSIWWIPGIPALLVVQLGVIFGISLALSSLNVFFRDLEHLTMLLTQLLFYLTPILYPEEVIPERYRWVLYLNPMSPIIPAWRSLILEGALDPGALALSAGISALTFALGYAVYRKLEWRFAESV